MTACSISAFQASVRQLDLRVHVFLQQPVVKGLTLQGVVAMSQPFSLECVHSLLHHLCRAHLPSMGGAVGAAPHLLLVGLYMPWDKAAFFDGLITGQADSHHSMLLVLLTQLHHFKGPVRLVVHATQDGLHIGPQCLLPLLQALAHYAHYLIWGESPFGLVPGHQFHFGDGQQVWAIAHLRLHHVLFGLHLDKLIDDSFYGLSGACNSRYVVLKLGQEVRQRLACPCQ